MKRFKLLAGILALTTVLVVSGCDFFSGIKIPSPDKLTLAETVVNELVTKLDENSAKAISSSRSFSTSSIETIKTEALKQIAADKLTDATTLDTILVSMLIGVQKAIGDTSAISEPAIAATIMKLATESAMGSMLIEDRKTNLSSGTSTEEAVGKLAETTIRAIILLVPDAAIVNDAINATVKLMVQELNDSTSSVLTSAVTQEAINAIVVGAVNATFDNSSNFVNTSDTVSSITTSVAEAVSSSTAFSTSEQAALVSSIISSAVATIVENASTATAQEIILTTVAEVVVSQGTNAPSTEVIFAAVNAGISTGSTGGTTTVVIDQTTITTVVNEPEPTITSAIADITTVLEKDTKVTLTAVGSTTNPNDTVSYEWVQVSGPQGFDGQVNNSGVHTFIPDMSGTYVFKVIVRNVNGFKQAESSPVIITANIPNASAEDQVIYGVNYLKERKWDDALTCFTKALALDPSSETAAFWKAFLELSSISVDPSIVNLMKNRIGLVDYPSSMNSLYSNTWLSGTYYSTRPQFLMITSPDSSKYYYARGTFTKDESSNTSFSYYSDSVNNMQPSYNYMVKGSFAIDLNGKDYIEAYSNGNYKTYTDFSGNTILQFTASDTLYEQKSSWIDLASPNLLPKLNVPTWIQPMLSAAQKNYGSDATHYTIYDYPLILIGNIVERNPTGINEALDLVLNGAYGARFNSAANAINNLAETASITIPNDLIYAFGGSSTVNMPNTVSITITKPMLQMALSQMYASKAFVELLASYNLSYPVSGAMADYTAISSPSAGLSLFKNPLQAGLGSDRSQATRNKAKEDMLLSLSTMDNALTALIASDLKAWVLKTFTGTPIDETRATQFETEAKNALSLIKQGVTVLKTSLTNKTSAYIELSDFSNGKAFKADYVWSNTASDTTIKIAPYALFETDIFNPQKLFAKTSLGGFKVYGCDTTTTDGSALPSNLVNFEELIDSVSQSALAKDTFAVELITSRIQEILPECTTMMPLSAGQSNYFLPMRYIRTEGVKNPDGTPVLNEQGQQIWIKSTPIPFDNFSEWPLIKWLRGE